MPYIVLVDDNFHFMDEDERQTVAEFASAHEALRKCREIVDACLAHEIQTGRSAQELWDQYVSFGDDPFIRCVDVPRVDFSAWEYAKQQCLKAGTGPIRDP